MRAFIETSINRIFSDDKKFKSDIMNKIKEKNEMIKLVPDGTLYTLMIENISIKKNAKHLLACHNKKTFVSAIITLFANGNDTDNATKQISNDFKNIEVDPKDIEFVKILIIFLDTYRHNDKITSISEFENIDEFIPKCLKYINLDETNKEILKFIKIHLESFQCEEKIEPFKKHVVKMINNKINS